MINSATKVCKKCGIRKNKNEFVQSQFIRTNGKCKSCQKDFRIAKKKEIDKYNRKYYQEHKDRLDIQHKEYYQENKDQLLEYQRAYFEENKGRIIKYNKAYAKTYSNEYRKNRIKNDPSFRLRDIISRSVRGAIKRNGDRKSGSCLDRLPYTIDELKIHLESQFNPWMTWQNHGKYDPKTWDDNDSATWRWQLDHIVPQSALPYTSMIDENFKKCWALSNLRPLNAKQNIIDRDRK